MPKRRGWECGRGRAADGAGSGSKLRGKQESRGLRARRRPLLETCTLRRGAPKPGVPNSSRG
eukprot:4211718-Alexandrium_andersonii.AAC.1